MQTSINRFPYHFATALFRLLKLLSGYSTGQSLQYFSSFQILSLLNDQNSLITEMTPLQKVFKIDVFKLLK